MAIYPRIGQTMIEVAAPHQHQVNRPACQSGCACFLRVPDPGTCRVTGWCRFAEKALPSTDLLEANTQEFMDSSRDFKTFPSVTFDQILAPVNVNLYSFKKIKSRLHRSLKRHQKKGRKEAEPHYPTTLIMQIINNFENLDSIKLNHSKESKQVPCKKPLKAKVEQIKADDLWELKSSSRLKTK